MPGQQIVINNKGTGFSKTKYMENFLVNQLKKQNRSLKTELADKDLQISELSKNVKLSKNREMDGEL